ncbi:MAG: ECF transporter S component [Acidobacteriota bacterium]
MSGRRGDLLSALALALATALGAWAFLSPFRRPIDAMASPSVSARAAEAPLLVLGLLGLCLAVIVGNLETRRMDSRVVAVLGVLVGLNAALRLVTGPLGVSAVFFLPILCAYVFGADFGFLLGTLSMLVSALLTGGLGPWLPFQMFTAGWCGMVAGWLPRFRRPAAALAVLVPWGIASGFLFGLLTNLWFWPYLLHAAPGQGYAEGLSFGDVLLRYLAFYVATSSWWDAGRALGTGILLVIAGPPVLRVLDRFDRRWRFTHLSAEAGPAQPGSTLPQI